MELAKGPFGVLVESIQSQLETRRQTASQLEGLLGPVLEEHGWQVLREWETLAGALVERGASTGDAARLYLLAGTPGFDELMSGAENTVQADLERFVHNAVDSTGLSRESVLQLCSDLACAAGLAVAVDSPQSLAGPLAGRTYVVPTAVYRETLLKFERDLTARRGDASVQLDLGELEPLAAMGLPKAQYYVGFCLLHGIGGAAESEKGLELLRAAADAGDAAASAALGDYYFGKGGGTNWTRAYEHYTGYGAAALNAQRRRSLAGIFDQKRFNGRILLCCAALLLLSAVTIFLAPAAALYPPRRVWGGICLLLEAGVFVWALLRYRARPYEFLYGVPVAMFAAWCLHLATRLLS